MKSIVFFLVVAVGIATISGCVSGADIAFNPDVSNTSPSIISELDQRRDTYLKCLTVKAIEQKMNDGRYSKESVKAICSPLGKRYYESVFAKAFSREKRSDFSHNTARSSITAIENTAFKRISEEMK